MNQIKIIKRANQQSLHERRETKAKKVSAQVNAREAAQVVANWIDEWRASKPNDAKRAFADLFNVYPLAVG